MTPRLFFSFPSKFQTERKCNVGESEKLRNLQENFYFYDSNISTDEHAVLIICTISHWGGKGKIDIRLGGGEGGGEGERWILKQGKTVPGGKEPWSDLQGRSILEGWFTCSEEHCP